MYNIGGWIAKPGSCNKGFKSRPSVGDGNKRANGLEVNNKNRMKPTLTRPITPSTRTRVASGICLLNIATKPVQIDSVKAQSNNDPSCAPHTPEIRYKNGKAVLEFCAT